MKRFFSTVISLLLVISATAQQAEDAPMAIDQVLNACIAMQQAVAANDTLALRQAADSLREVETASFRSLKCKDDTILATLAGHFVFNENFADSLASGSDAYAQADELARTSTHRGQTPDGTILTKTCFVKAGASTRYSFPSRGKQELAVVAEAGGLVTMKIHATNSAGLDEWHSDTRDVKAGRPHRRATFELPADRRNTVELEVINCCDKDITFVVISN